MSKADLTSIKERIEKAPAPSRDLFLVVVNALDVDQYTIARALALCDVHAWTDASLALVERLLPGWARSHGNHPKPWAKLIPADDYGDPFTMPYEGTGATEALALLSVLITSLHNGAESP